MRTDERNAAMPNDLFRYDLLCQDALRGVVRAVLKETAQAGGLPGDHHFYITFDTRARGVRLSNRMRERYPERMTVVLQHQFWDLAATEHAFEVGLSFGGIPERLLVPFDSVVEFVDPSVQFALQFDVPPAEAQAVGDAKPATEGAADETTRAKPAAAKTPALVESASVEKAVGDAAPTGEGGGAQVVSLDKFRKK